MDDEEVKKLFQHSVVALQLLDQAGDQMNALESNAVMKGMRENLLGMINILEPKLNGMCALELMKSSMGAPCKVSNTDDASQDKIQSSETSVPQNTRPRRAKTTVIRPTSPVSPRASKPPRDKGKTVEINLDVHLTNTSTRNRDCLATYEPDKMKNSMALLPYDAHTCLATIFVQFFGLESEMDVKALEDVTILFFKILQSKMGVIRLAKLNEKSQAVSSIDEMYASADFSLPLSQVMETLVGEQSNNDDNALVDIDAAIEDFFGRCNKTLRREHTRFSLPILTFLRVTTYLIFGLRLSSRVTLAETEKRLRTTNDSYKFNDLLGLIPGDDEDEKRKLNILDAARVLIRVGQNDTEVFEFVEFICQQLTHIKWKPEYAEAESVPADVPFQDCDEKAMRDFVDANKGLYIFGRKDRRVLAMEILKTFLLSEISAKILLVEPESRMLLRMGLLLMPLKSFTSKAPLPLNELFKNAALRTNRYIHKKDRIDQLLNETTKAAIKGFKAFGNDLIFVQTDSEAKDFLEQYHEHFDEVKQ